MHNDAWNVGYHLRSPKSWLNDPNGLCQFGETYRFFYQYNEQWPFADQKAWGQFSSKDLVHWSYEGVCIEPSIPEDQDGVWSGCTVAQPNADGSTSLRAYYTGNVVSSGPTHNPKDAGRACEGRESNQITCASKDGVCFGPKQVLLRNTDYPDYCSLHVRDPKVWRQDGTLFMLLGARDTLGRGMCLLYESIDGLNWTFSHDIRPQYAFGYMWECPNVAQADGVDYLAVCPQGLPRQHDKWHNLCQAGYFPLPSSIVNTTEVDERTFVEWDHGHDFYAPQIFVDASGRTILVGWLGGFDHRYQSAPNGLPWCHCLTVPRLLTRCKKTGLLLQNPVPELATLRRDPKELASSTQTDVEGRQAEIVLPGIAGEGSLSLDDDFTVYYKDGRLGLRYRNAQSAAGREERSIPCSALNDLRVFVDGSVVEVYANGGSSVFSSRWFCEQRSSVGITSTFACKSACVWPLEDTMSKVYDSLIVS